MYKRQGYRPDSITQLVQRYFDQVLVAMTDNPEIAAAFAKVQNMLATPATLFHPRIVWQVLSAVQQTTGKSPMTRPITMSERMQT